MFSVKKLALAAVAAVLIVPFVSALPPGTADEIRERLAPAGSLCRAGDDCGAATAAVASGPLSGQQVYDQFCFACHMSGVGGAPVLGDAAAWQPRIDKGMEVLMQSTLNGIGAMPARGTCATCSDDELQAAVEYMTQ